MKKIVKINNKMLNSFYDVYVYIDKKDSKKGRKLLKKMDSIWKISESFE